MATGQQRGPFDRILRTTDEPPERGAQPRDRGAIYVAGTIVGLAILLLILLVPPVSILSRGGGSGTSAIPSGPGIADTYTSTPRSGIPRLPAGLVAASQLFDMAAPENQRGASRITIPLKDKQTDARNLGLYSYVDGKWQRLSDVTLVAGGEAARGDVSSLPGNIAVLRRSKSTLQVAGVIPAGATLDKRAESSITTLHPLVFLPAADGSLAGTSPAVPPAGYKVVPAVVPLDPQVVDTILRSTELQATHAQAIADKVREGNFSGIDIDYRGVNPTLRAQFTEFVTLLKKDLGAQGRSLTLTLPMPESKDGSFNTGAYDWEALGKVADTIELGGEVDQELYFQNTEPALNYIVGKVDRAKVLLTISSLSVERGSDGLRTMPLDDALALATVANVKTAGDIAPGGRVQIIAQNLAPSENASGMRWDDAARAVTFRYPGRGGTRTVWIANAFSAAFRLDLAQRYNLGGVVISDVSSAAADVWTPVQQLSDAGAVTLSRPNGELLTPAWTANAGSLAPQTGDTVTWTAPAAAGAYTVTLIVSDGVVRAGQVLSLDVVSAAPPP